jgi:hypothetical protein
MAIAAEALAVIAGTAPPQAALSTRAHRRMRDLLGRLDRREFDEGTFAEIARGIGMSARD